MNKFWRNICFTKQRGNIPFRHPSCALGDDRAVVDK